MKPDIAAIKAALAQTGVIGVSREEVDALCRRVVELEAALSVALGLYTNPDAESEIGYAQYRMASAVLEGSEP